MPDILHKLPNVAVHLVQPQGFLRACRLVTLSACETGITDIRQSPDEFIGLPAGFLQAGAPAVGSTLWPVNDLSTMLLMERFYQNFLADDRKATQPPAGALREAQLWLREVTARELTERFAAEEAAPLAAGAPAELAGDQFLRFAAIDPQERRPFAHPYHWAGPFVADDRDQNSP